MNVVHTKDRDEMGTGMEGVKVNNENTHVFTIYDADRILDVFF